MLQDMGRRLRLVLDGSNEPPGTEPDWSATTDAGPVSAVVTLGPLVDFVAYAEDCMLSGQIRLGGERLTDLLNGHDTWQLVDVMAESFDGTELVESREVTIDRGDILVVHVSGPRGNNERRHRTNLHPVAVQAGRLRVRGYLHARPGLDPFAVIPRSLPMLPLTEASIEYEHHGVRERRRVGTVVVNRDRIDLIERIADHEIALPDLVFAPI
jgi:hypothetical protein